MKRMFAILLVIVLVGCQKQVYGTSTELDTFMASFCDEAYYARQNVDASYELLKGDIEVADEDKVSCGNAFEEEYERYMAILDKYHEEIYLALNYIEEKTDEDTSKADMVASFKTKENYILSIYDNGVASLRLDLDNTVKYKIEDESIERIKTALNGIKNDSFVPCWERGGSSIGNDDVDVVLNEYGIPTYYDSDDFYLTGLDQDLITDISVRFLGSGYDEVDTWPLISFDSEMIKNDIIDMISYIHLKKTDRSQGDLMPVGWFYYGGKDAVMTISFTSGYKFVIHDHYVSGTTIKIIDDNDNVISEKEYYGDQDKLIFYIYDHLAYDRLLGSEEFSMDYVTPLAYKDEDITITSSKDVNFSGPCIIDFKERGIKAYIDGKEIDSLNEDNDGGTIVDYVDQNGTLIGANTRCKHMFTPH